MKLSIEKRTGKTKSELKQIRHLGNLPAVLYRKGAPTESIVIKGEDFYKAMREIQQGYLPTTVFELSGQPRSCKALVKDIEYHPVTYEILHIDLQELQDDQPVNVRIPIECVGRGECVGIKQGGSLRQVQRHVRIRCLPKEIPTSFVLNIQDLNIGDSKRVRDIEMTQGMRCLFPMHEVVALIAKR